MKIYTKAGDKGKTSLYGGSRVSKASPQVHAYGAVDEANCFIGLAASSMENDSLRELLRLCQRKLIVIQSELASDSRGLRMLKEKIALDDAVQLEKVIDAISGVLEKHTNFSEPGLSVKSSYLQIARAKVRASEREIVEIHERQRVRDEILIYINRLSDLLFILSRAVDELEMFK